MQRFTYCQSADLLINKMYPLHSQVKDHASHLELQTPQSVQEVQKTIYIPRIYEPLNLFPGKVP